MTASLVGLMSLAVAQSVAPAAPSVGVPGAGGASPGAGAAPDAREMRAPPWAGALSGYWRSLITENWRLRMLTPPKGDYVGIPLTAAAKALADAWDPARDSAEGNQCRAYGAPAIMFRPEHLRFEWQDGGETLRMSIDAGMQVRLLHFAAAAPAVDARSWQGYSTAAWVARRNTGLPPAPNARYLQVITTALQPGYLRQNGVPYSSNAVFREAYDLLTVLPAESYLSVTGTVTDGLYLDYPLVLSAIFQKQPDAAGWDPTPCSSTW